MTPWQKRARLAVAILAISVVAIVVYTMRPREAAAPPPSIGALDKDATMETRGADVVRFKGGDRDLRRRDVRVHRHRQLAKRREAGDHDECRHHRRE